MGAVELAKPGRLRNVVSAAGEFVAGVAGQRTQVAHGDDGFVGVEVGAQPGHGGSIERSRREQWQLYCVRFSLYHQIGAISSKRSFQSFIMQ